MDSAVDYSDAAVAREVISEILAVLRKGPRSPCYLDRYLEIPEIFFHAHLAELLAREWVTIVADPPVNGSLGDAAVRARLDKAYDSHRELGSLEDPEEVVQRRTLLWRDELQSLWAEGLTSNTIVVITASGRSVTSV